VPANGGFTSGNLMPPPASGGVPGTGGITSGNLVPPLTGGTSGVVRDASADANGDAKP
jgi:hypothetical protein